MANNIVLAPTATSRRRIAASTGCAKRSKGAIHTDAYQYLVESLGPDEKEIFNAYNEIPSMRDKDHFLIPLIEVISDPDFKTGTLETIRSCCARSSCSPVWNWHRAH